LKGKHTFGYKFIAVIALIVAIGHVTARGHHDDFDYDPAPQPDSPAANGNNDNAHAKAAIDTAHNLRFPIHDKTGDPQVDQMPSSIDLKDPPNLRKSVDYDPAQQRYYINDKIGDEFFRNPTYMTMDEYLKYQGEQDENAYWQRRLDALSLFNKKPELPQMYKEGLFDRIFGNNSITVKPQGNVDVTFGGNWQNIKNPALVQRAQKYGIFDFDMQMNINLLATVGDKLKLNISNNTKATFDYQNMQKLEYTGKEDEIIKKIEAGNISFPLKSNLISGVQSLFGLKTTLQFGKLWVTGVLSQQKSQRKSLTVQGGAQTQTFAIKADNYEENRDFFLSQYFHDDYNKALKDFPVINSLVTLNRVEIWVTNTTGAVTGVRNIYAFMDLGEKNPYNKTMTNGTGPTLPDNTSNRLYGLLQQNPAIRVTQTASVPLIQLGLTNNVDYTSVYARKLNTSEYTFNPQLGYVLLNTQLNASDILGVAYRYTYKGKTYQVGEFAEDLPPDTTNSKALFLKLLKNINPSPTLPTWQLMMKNVYALGGLGVSKDNFTLNILYQDPGGGEKRYIPDGPNAGVPLLTLLNLDRLNSQNEAQPDGVFDFVDGITINTQQGKVIFPVTEPFGRNLAPSLGTDPNLQRKYVYDVLYDSTRTVALQDQQNDRYIMRGAYKSTSSSEIFLGGFNIPPGSVTVTAGGTKLIENSDYQIDYGLGRLKILNTGILNSGIPINVQYEDNSTFGFQQQNFLGARFDYYINKKLTIGATAMRLTERPFTQKVNFGDDPIKNTVLGLDANYQSEVPALTRALDKLPIYATTAPSFVSASGEVATLLPGHPKQINALDPEGSVYIDDFEGTSSSYDMKLPALAWSLASTPVGAVNKTGQTLFPEANNADQLSYGYNRAKLAWYFIEPTLVDGINGTPGYVKNEPNQHYIRLVQQTDVFPTASYNTLQSSLSTLDLGYYPNQRGPYNFDNNAVPGRGNTIDSVGKLNNPTTRWGGIMRPVDNTDFEASNVEYIQFWMLDPFIHNQGAPGGSLYFNLGDVSEDVLKDSRLFFENGIPYPADRSQLDTTIWGYVPKFEQQVTRAFNNDPASRAAQDVGYDGLDDAGEAVNYSKFLTAINGSSMSGAAKQQLLSDPSSDNYHYYLGDDYDQANLGVLARYKNYNNPQGNSPITSATASYSSAATTIPESEDINKDNTLNQAENYYQYRVDLTPGVLINKSNPYIVNSTKTTVKLPNGSYESEDWYQFKIPIQNYDHRIGSIGDFRSIRFVRMFMAGWADSTIIRFATLELGRNQWRNYNYSLETPGEIVPQPNQPGTDFSVTSVSVEENSLRTPVPYVIPPGVSRQLSSVANGQNIQLNEQALSLRICPLKDGDARAVYKEVDVDMRQFTYLRLFMHAESEIGQTQLKNGDVRGFIRIGSDFTNNYYEYQVPLAITQVGASSDVAVWPTVNNINLTLQDLVTAKEARDSKQINPLLPYQTTDSKGNIIVVVGNPNIGNAKNIMLGVLNPKKSTQNAADDGLSKCVEVWFNEMRMAGVNDHAGYAAAGKVNFQLADLGSVNLSGSMHTAGYGNIDQKIQQRFQDNFYQYNATTNLALGKLLPRKWGVQLPLFVGYNQNVSTPKYDPYNQDVVLNNELDAARNAASRDSIRKAAQEFTSITSINLTNVRILGSPDKQSAFRMPWSIKNFDLSYSYNDQFKHNPTIAFDNLVTNKTGVGLHIRNKIETNRTLQKAHQIEIEMVPAH
jgi:cell surface protein SprA